MSRERPRLGIAVEPPVFGGALATALEELDVGEVVRLHGAPEAGPEDFDAVVATIGLPLAAHAPVVIRLPSDGGGKSPALVEAGGLKAEVQIDRLTSLLGVLDAYCPGLRARRH